ncbi:MAG: HAD-IA family hydrolase [Gemmatimonadetes bacterium]|nr:HAD-IA family hydrolase [Gemmatimonadota bacterium]
MKAIIFDAGNTLVWLDHELIADLLREHGMEASPEALLAAEYEAKRKLDEMIRNGDGGTDASRWRFYFQEILRVIGTIEESMSEIIDRLEGRHAERNLWCRVRERTVEALDELRSRGYRLGVISNSDGRIESLLDSVGLLSQFEFVIDSQLVGVEKPDPKIFQMACQRLGLRPDEVMYVGDIYEIDVVGARNAGLRALLIDPLNRWNELDCDRVAAVSELPEWLAQRA